MRVLPPYLARARFYQLAHKSISAGKIKFGTRQRARRFKSEYAASNAANDDCKCNTGKDSHFSFIHVFHLPSSLEKTADFAKDVFVFGKNGHFYKRHLMLQNRRFAMCIICTSQNWLFLQSRFTSLPKIVRFWEVGVQIVPHLHRDKMSPVNRVKFEAVKLVDFDGFKLFPTTMSGTYLIFNAIMAIALKNRTK